MIIIWSLEEEESSALLIPHPHYCLTSCLWKWRLKDGALSRIPSYPRNYISTSSGSEQRQGRIVLNCFIYDSQWKFLVWVVYLSPLRYRICLLETPLLISNIGFWWFSPLWVKPVSLKGMEISQPWKWQQSEDTLCCIWPGPIFWGRDTRNLVYFFDCKLHSGVCGFRLPWWVRGYGWIPGHPRYPSVIDGG